MNRSNSRSISPRNDNGGCSYPTDANYSPRRSRWRSRSNNSYRRSRSGSSSHSRRRSKYSRSRSRSSSRYRSRSGSFSGRRRKVFNGAQPKPSKCIGVFGLSVSTSERRIRDIFSKYGKLDNVQVVYDAKTGRSRGFCFVYYDSVDDAKYAKEQCSGMEIDGRRIRVDFSITQRAHTPTPGIYMGNPTRYDRRWSHRRDNDDYGSSRYRRSPSPYYRSSYRSSRNYDRSRSRS